MAASSRVPEFPTTNTGIIPFSAALENNATWLSADRGFARFQRLRWVHPLER